MLNQKMQLTRCWIVRSTFFKYMIGILYNILCSFRTLDGSVSSNPAHLDSFFMFQFSAHEYHWPGQGLVDQGCVITALTFFFLTQSKRDTQTMTVHRAIIRVSTMEFLLLSVFFSSLLLFLYFPFFSLVPVTGTCDYKLTLTVTLKAKRRHACFCCKANMGLKLYFQVNLKSSWLLPWFWPRFKLIFWLQIFFSLWIKFSNDQLKLLEAYIWKTVEEIPFRAKCLHHRCVAFYVFWTCICLGLQ